MEHLWETENERDLLEDVNERLRRELSLSEAREAALRDTIKLAMGGGGAQARRCLSASGQCAWACPERIFRKIQGDMYMVPQRITVCIHDL